jgi:hypothetical protein
MRTNDTLAVLKQLFSQPTRAGAVMLFGAPGTGKTAIVAQAAAAAGKELRTIALPTCEAVDVRGMPVIVDGQTRWASPLPRDGEGVLLLDELSSAAPDVQVAAHHLVWDEQGSDLTLPAGWHVVATGNRAADRAVHRPMPSPLRNRMTLIDVETDADTWAAWAARNNVHPFVQGFIRWLPGELTVKEIPDVGAFPSPRAWARASNVLSLAVSPAVESELLAGIVGQAAAVKFSAYLATARTLPDIEAIMREPGKAPLPGEPSLRYAITCSLAQYTRMRQQSAMKYIERLPAEYAVLYIREIRDVYDIRGDADVRAWVGKHVKLFDTGEML